MFVFHHTDISLVQEPSYLPSSCVVLCIRIQHPSAQLFPLRLRRQPPSPSLL